MSPYPYIVDPYMFRDIFAPPVSKPPTPPSPAQRLADEVAQLGRDHSADLGVITRAVDEVEAERRATTEKAVRGALDIAKLGSAKSRRFRLVYQASNKDIKVVEGVEFPDDRADKSRESLIDLVFVSYPYLASPTSARSYRSMKRLKELLGENKVIYVIDYID